MAYVFTNTNNQNNRCVNDCILGVMMGIILDINNLIKEDAIEVQRLVQNDGMGYLQAIQAVTDYRPCYQQNGDNLIKNNNNIIAENEGLDNLEIYDLTTGETLRDLKGE